MQAIAPRSHVVGAATSTIAATKQSAAGILIALCRNNTRSPTPPRGSSNDPPPLALHHHQYRGYCVGTCDMCEPRRDVGMEWQPIETAPFGGEVLACTETGAIYIAFQAGELGHGDGTYWMMCDGPEITGVTHWMPLPPPPVTP